jgi:hypothetical protein
MKKEIVYTMDYGTVEEIKKAENKRAKLYEKYNSVQVYPQGNFAVKIVATDKI